MKHYNNYLINIFERYTDLKKSNKSEYDNYDLSKIFEYYSCIKLSEEYNKPFYEYNDIDPTFKEINKMSRNDTGIDCCDLIDTIVQCKLRKHSLTWKECSTFFGSQVIYSSELNKPIIRWNNLIIARNSDSTLSENILERKELFIDRPYNKDELIKFCENLIINPPKYPVFNEEFKLRDYQLEAIKIIKSKNKNVIINLPTGTGKNSVIIYSLDDSKKYLILVPRIILMDQLKTEIIKHKPHMKKHIQLIGDNNNTFNEDKLITICVYNSVHIISDFKNFEKIVIDEAHHINKPEIYYNDSDVQEDPNDKELIKENYIQIIESLIKYNNNVYVSATIDPINNFEYYSKDIRTMIDLKYLCDYNIHVPIFSDDPTNKNICYHLIKNYRNIIIYCNSQKEGKLINKLMNELQNNSSDYIDCNTNKKKRNDIIEKYKKGDIPFLINVKILVEGFDAPITKGVCFLHLPHSQTTLIQIIGRCLRLHPTKNIANIILPFSSIEDENNICNFLKVIAKNDSRIKKSFENKTLGGYISIDNIDNDENIEFKYNMIYNSLGILLNGNEIWLKRLEEVKLYIDENNKRPSSKHDKNKEIKSLGNWIGSQQKHYKTKKCIMSNEEIYKIWTEFINSDKYKIYFLSNEDNWKLKLNEVKTYININNKIPSQSDKNKDIKSLSSWVSTQHQNYKTNTGIMSNDEIYTLWTEFINNDKYRKYFMSNEDNWKFQLDEVKNYIDTNNRTPSKHDKNVCIAKEGIWISTQHQNYKTKKQIMSNEEIYSIWTDFINSDKYKRYFISNEDNWKLILDEVKKYIDTNNNIPSVYDKNTHIKYIGAWIKTQHINYKEQEKIMSNKEIYSLWTEFINSDKYKEYFISNNDNWKLKFNKVKSYIDINNKRPSSSDKNKQIQSLGHWISTQTDNYKTRKEIMSNKEIYKIWTDFINSDKYKTYFISNEDNWKLKLDEIKKYIDINNKRPSSEDKDKNIKKIGIWILTQTKNYNTREEIMSNEEIYKIWTDFINSDKYKTYFISNEDNWKLKLDEIKKYIDINNKKPPASNKDKQIQILGSWINTQNRNYKNREDIMKNEEINTLWATFINSDKYRKYFISNEDNWKLKLNEIKIYIDINNKRPSSSDKYIQVQRFAQWISDQRIHYKTKKYIMANEEIYKIWTDFINSDKYKEYF